MRICREKIVIERQEKYEYDKKITKMEDVVDLVRDVMKIQNEAQEVCYVLAIDSRNKTVCFTEIGRGSTNVCSILIADIYKYVLLSNCKKFILLHNHPSGDTTPSKEDIKITKTLLKGTKLLGIQMLDHIVIGNNKYQSCMAEI